MPTRPYFIYPFAVDGDLTAIPETVQGDGSVSYQEGFGPDYALEYGVNPDALPVPRTKSNQLYNDITTAIQQIQQNGFNLWISSADNGGSPYAYGIGTIVYYTDGNFYQTNVDANVTTPGASSTWQLLPITQQGLVPVVCDCASTTSLTLSGVQSIDGIPGAAGVTVVGYFSGTAATNGVYIMQVGAWTRSPYYNTAKNILPGSIIPVRAGTINGNKYFQLVTSGPIVVGTTGLTFSSPAATVSDNSITNAKLAQAPALTMKGNNFNATANEQDLTVAQINSILGSLSGLKIINNVATPNTKTDITTNAAGTLVNDATTVGANGLDAGSLANNIFYYFYYIVNASGVIATLCSTSASSPTLPGGYTKVCYIGSRVTDSSAHFQRINQFGNQVRYVIGINPATLPVIQSGIQSGWNANSTVGYCSPFALAIRVTISNPEQNGAIIGIAPNNSYSTSLNTTPTPPLLLNADAGAGGNNNTDLIYFETANTIYYHASVSGNGAYCSGWVENL